MSGRVRIADALRLPAGFLPVAVVLLAFWSAGSAIAADRFPLAMKDDRGVAVRLLAPPRRVVSLAPSLTEIVFLLGRDGSLVGVTRFCNVPAAASGLPKIGGVSDPDVERIVALSPDLVLCTTDGNPRDKVRALEEMGIPCFAVSPQDLEAVFTAIERIGVLLGAADRGRAEAGALRHRARLAPRRPRRGNARGALRRLHRPDHRRRRRHLHGRTGASRRRQERRRALLRQVPAALRGGVWSPPGRT